MTSGEYCPRRQRRKQQQQQQRRRPRPRLHQSAGLIAATIGSSGLAALLHAPLSQAVEESSTFSPIGGIPDSGHEHPRRLDYGGPRNLSIGCSPDQHTLLFTMFTDTHSILDNSWQFTHASYGYGYEMGNSGEYIDSESVAMGNLGYGAVLSHQVCADKATKTTVDGGGGGGAGESAFVESCYDLEIRDKNGDGLTVPYSAQGGLAGGFSLKIDGSVVAEHRGKACLSDDDEEWNECVIESGFEYCGVRVCTANEGAGGSAGTSSAGKTIAGKATVSNLSGSQCAFSRPQCDADSDDSVRSSSSSVSVNVDTDSFAQELSWELRKSSRSESKDMDRAWQNDLLLAGGMPVYRDGSDEDVLLGQPGVGVPLADNESYSGVACLPDPDDGAPGSCFDLRAYDAYGDGAGCGADGAISVVIETAAGETADGSPLRERVSLTQRDKDMAKRQRVDGGEKRLACLHKEKLSKWTYCAVRVCANGDVIGLQGNQCDFGLGDALIDENYSDVDPLAGLKMKPLKGDDRPEKDDEEEKEDEEDAGVIQLEDLQLNVINAFNAGDNFVEEVEVEVIVEENEEENIDPTWAEYYETLKPGFRNDDDDLSSFSAITLAGAMSGPSKETNMAMNFIAMNANENQDYWPMVKPDKKDKDGPNPQNQQLNSQVSNRRKEKVELKPFSINLLDVNFPYPLKNSRRPSQLSDAVADYLLSYFAENAEDNDVPAPTDFELDCTKSEKKIGPEVRWGLDCEGEAEFQLPSTSSLPSKRAMAAVISDAFKGRSKQNFLETMYDYEDGDKNDKKPQTKRQKLKAEKQTKMQQQFGEVNSGGGGRSEKKRERSKRKNQKKQEESEASARKSKKNDRKEQNDKRQTKREELKAKKKEKQKRLEKLKEKNMQQQFGDVNFDANFVSNDRSEKEKDRSKREKKKNQEKTETSSTSKKKKKNKREKRTETSTTSSEKKKQNKREKRTETSTTSSEKEKKNKREKRTETSATSSEKKKKNKKNDNKRLETLKAEKKDKQTQLEKLKSKKKKQERTETSPSRSEKKKKKKQEKLNNIGYMSGTQLMTELADPDDGYVVLAGGITIDIDIDIEGGRSRNKNR